jgi:hypothetical protein
MNRAMPLLAAIATAFGAAAPLPGQQAEASQTALAVAERSMEAMGGQRAFQEARLLRFDFAVVRDGATVARFAHWWDLHSGAYRLEGRDPDGAPFRALFDIETRQGEVWREGARLDGAEADALLDTAYRRFINDSYWLLMPWKWLDPGVVLAHVGVREIDGQTFDVVELRFQTGVGLTSGDRYWGFVSRDSGLMERWEYVLQQQDGSPGEGPPTAWAWEEWRQTAAGPKLATVRRRLGEGPAVSIEIPVQELVRDISERELTLALRPPPETPLELP